MITASAGCAIRVSVAYVAFLYCALTNNSLLLSEKQVFAACPIAVNETIACAMTQMTAHGIASAYHYERAIARPAVSLRATEMICSSRADTIECLREWLAAPAQSGTIARAFIAPQICGIILSVTPAEEINETVISVRNLEGAIETIAIHGDDSEFARELGSQFWSTTVFDPIEVQDETLSTTVSLQIAQIALIVSAIVGFIAKCSAKRISCPQKTTETPLYLAS